MAPKFFARRAALGTVVLALGTFSTAFGLTTYAWGIDDAPGFSRTLPVAALAPVAVPGDVKVRLNNAIGPFLSAMGITTDSYTQVRLLTGTGNDSIYVVPGSNGVCLVIQDSSACGRPGSADGPYIALFASDSDGNAFGGGISVATTDHITVTFGEESVRLPVREGTFILSSAAALKMARPFETTAD